MAVASLLTTIASMEGAGPTIIGRGGGQAGALNTDIFIEGAQSVGRRVDNATDKGVGVSVTAVDLSGADEHVMIWCFVTQWAQVTLVRAVLSDSTNDDDHTFPSALYPDLGGFVPIWVDVSRTPETGGSANEAAIDEFQISLNIGNVGGNAPNLIIDNIVHGTSGYRWTGTGPGDFDDFRTFETNNREGVFITLNGVDFCYARLEVGDATAESDFTDSGFTIAFPDQTLVATDFMGITLNMNNASSVVSLSDGTIQSANIGGATRRPDFIVSGTTGALTTSGLNLLGMRQVTFTSLVDFDGGILDALDLTQASAEIQNCVIRPRSASGVAMCNDATFGTTSGIHDVTVQQAGSGHFIEITSPGSYTFTNIDFTGFGGTPGSNPTANSGANDAAIYNNSGGAVTINVSGGSQPSVRNGASSTTTVSASVTVEYTFVDDDTGSPIEGVSVILTASTAGDVIDNLLSNASGVVSVSYTGSTPQAVTGFAAKGSETPTYKRRALSGTIQSGSGLSQTIRMTPD